MGSKKHKALLRRIFNDPSSAGGYAGLEPLYHAARAEQPDVTREDVRHFLEGDRTYTLFKPTRTRYRRLKTVPSGFLTDIQVDLADLQKLAEHNGGRRYILVAVDVLSRRVFAIPTKSKSSNHMKAAFERLFRSLPHLPWRIFSDNVSFERCLQDFCGNFRDWSLNLVKCAPSSRTRVSRNMLREAMMLRPLSRKDLFEH